jgi:hypothetical protein
MKPLLEKLEVNHFNPINSASGKASMIKLKRRMNMKRRIMIISAVISLSFVFIIGCQNTSEPEIITPEPSLLIDYSTNPEGGDWIRRGFYIESYPGTTLSSVTLWFWTSSADDYTIQIEAREDTYDGTLVGQALESASLGTSPISITFDFGDVTVTKNNALTFQMSWTGGSISPYYCFYCDEFDSMTAEEINVIETDGTDPPLDTFRNDGVAIQVYGQP